MTASFRTGTNEFRTRGETNFATEPVDFASAKESIATWGDEMVMKKEPLENQAKRSDFGEHEVGEGVAHPVATYNCNSYGLGIGNDAMENPGFVDSLATRNAFTDMAAAVLGGAPAFSTGSTAATTPTNPHTASLITEADAGNHAQGGFVGVMDTTSPDAAHENRMYPRFITSYDNVTNPGEMALNFDLPFVPAAGDLLYGMSAIPYAEQHTQTMFAESIGKNDEQNYKMRGMIGNLSIAEVATNQPLVWAWAFRCGAFDELFTQAQVAAENLRPRAIAGGEGIIGLYGRTDYQALKYGRFSLELGNTFEAEEDWSDIGLDGWFKNNMQLRFSCHFREKSGTPPGVTANTWREAWSTGGTQTLFHAQITTGRLIPGRIVTIYMPMLRLLDRPEKPSGGVNGKAVTKCTFGAAQGAPLPFINIGQG